MQPEMFLNHNTRVFEIQTTINKLTRIAKEQEIKPYLQQHAIRTVQQCLNIIGDPHGKTRGKITRNIRGTNYRVHTPNRILLTHPSLPRATITTKERETSIPPADQHRRASFAAMRTLGEFLTEITEDNVWEYLKNFYDVDSRSHFYTHEWATIFGKTTCCNS